MPLALDKLLAEAVRLAASDLLLVPGAPPTIRLHGHLAPVPGDPAKVDAEDAANALSIHMSPRDSGSYRSGHAVDFCFQLTGVGRFRCNLHRTQDGSSASMRVLPEIIPDISMLHLPEQVAGFAEMLKGFVLVVGPTGAGKSTTLACLIDRINHQRPAHIVTIEDPVEYRHQHRQGLVEQIEIGTDAPTFAEALRHSLRQDPDVIFVGEMRDLETISIALTAAETGHLVFSTLHTRDAVQAIDRIIDVFPSDQQNQVRQQLSLSLTGVIAQHLVPAVDAKQRRPAVEILKASDAVRNLIRTGKTHLIYSAMVNSRSGGMQTLEDSLASLVRQRIISRENALLHANHVEEMKSMLR